MVTFKRIPTGIIGFDELVEGGLPDRSSILVQGGAGTGKTTFGLQYLFEGAKNDEQCLFLALSDLPEKISQYASRFTFFKADDPKVASNIFFLSRRELAKEITTRDPKLVVKSVMDIIKNRNINRLIIDPINILTSILADYIIKSYDPREFLTDFAIALGEQSCSSMLIYEDTKECTFLPYLVDGVITLELVRKEDRSFRILHIDKMRGTNQAMQSIPYTVSDDGIKVYPDVKIFETESQF